MNYATIGSISRGTLRSADLIDTFASELEYQLNRNAAEFCDDAGRAMRDRIVSAIWDARELIGDDYEILNGMECEASESVEILADMLQEFAPPYARFGAHEGDGSDFGFWPDFDALECDAEDGTVYTCSDLANVPDDYSGTVYVVNDHGNGTVYACESGRTTMIFDFV